MPTLKPLGDSALLITLGDEIDTRLNQRVHALASLIDSAPLVGIRETVPAYATLLVHYDPLQLTYSQIADWLRARLDQADSATTRPPRRARACTSRQAKACISSSCPESTSGDLSLIDTIPVFRRRRENGDCVF